MNTNLQARIQICAQGPTLPDWHANPGSQSYRDHPRGRPFAGLDDTEAAISACLHEAFADGPDTQWHKWSWGAYLGLFEPRPDTDCKYRLVGHNTLLAMHRVEFGIDRRLWTTTQYYAVAARHYLWLTDYGPDHLLGALGSLETFELRNAALAAELAGGTILTWIDLQSGGLVRRRVQTVVEATVC